MRKNEKKSKKNLKFTSYRNPCKKMKLTVADEQIPCFLE